MSWKSSTLAIILISAVTVGLTLGGPIQSASAGCPCCQKASAPSDNAGPKVTESKSDKELIEKQKICPVTGEELGSMGKPVKVVVKGRTVFLCCAGCKKKLLADPDKYLKKLDEKKAGK